MSPLYSSKKVVCEANKGLLNQLRQKICRKTTEIKKNFVGLILAFSLSHKCLHV